MRINRSSCSKEINESAQETAHTSKKRRLCYRCRSESHIAKDCPQSRQKAASAEASLRARLNQLSGSAANHYAEVVILKNKKKLQTVALFDTGSSKSCIPADLIKWCISPMKPTKIEMYNASSQKVNILGEADIEFSINGRHFRERVVCSD